MIAPSAAQAVSLLRDASTFQWYVIPLLLLVIHAYGEQAANGRWNVVMGGLAFWLMDWVNEIWNALVLHFSGVAPMWAAPGKSAYLILVGLNIEICFMFAIMGLYAVRTLPRDKSLRWFGINHRWLLAAGNSVLCVLVELVLNRIGVLTWEWPFWGAHAPFLIWLVGYLPFFLVAYWVHDLDCRKCQISFVGALGAAVLAALGLFGAVLHWI